MRSAILAIAFLLPLPVVAQPDADAQEIKSFRLTDASLAKYAQATRNIRRLPIGNCDLTSPAIAIDELASKLAAAPGAKTAVASAGMTTREYVVFGLAVAHSAMATYGADKAGGALPAGTQSNVEFYKKHEGEFSELAGVPQTGGCG